MKTAHTQNQSARSIVLSAILMAGSLGTPTLHATPEQLLFQAAPIPLPLVETTTPSPLQPSANATAQVAAGTSDLADVKPGANVLARATLRRFSTSIDQLQAEEGPYAQGLAEQYLASAGLHQQLGEYDEALALLAKAEHNHRVNFGLNAVEQFLPIELSIDIHLTRQDYQQAIDRQEYLLHLHQGHYGREAAALVPQLAKLGDMYFAAFERGIERGSGGSGLEMKMGPESAFIDPNKLSALDISFLWLRQAQAYYHRSITSLLDHEQFFDPLLLSLENRLIGTLFLQAHRRNIEHDPEFFLAARDPQLRDELRFKNQQQQRPGYRDGIAAFTRIITYLRHNPDASPQQVAHAMLELGDWHLLFGHTKQARRQYHQTREWLQQQGLASEAIEDLLAPAVPQQLPTFLAAPHAPPAGEHSPHWEGYVDVAFTLNPVGKVNEISVLDKSANADASVEDRLKRVLRTAPFRPAVAASDTPADTQQHSVRYYFAHR